MKRSPVAKWSIVLFVILWSFWAIYEFHINQAVDYFPNISHHHEGIWCGLAVTIAALITCAAGAFGTYCQLPQERRSLYVRTLGVGGAALFFSMLLGLVLALGLNYESWPKDFMLMLIIGSGVPAMWLMYVFYRMRKNI